MVSGIILCGFRRRILLGSFPGLMMYSTMDLCPINGARHKYCLVVQALNPSIKWLVIPIIFMPLLPQWKYCQDSRCYTSQGSLVGKNVVSLQVAWIETFNIIKLDSRDDIFNSVTAWLSHALWLKHMSTAIGSSYQVLRVTTSNVHAWHSFL